MLSRRQLLSHGAGLLPLALAAGCSPGKGPQLMAVRGELPKTWLSNLPQPWGLREVETSSQVAEAVNRRQPNLGLVQLSDGWASGINRKLLQPFSAPDVFAQFTAAAGPVSRLYAPEGQTEMGFPWSYSPWVLAFRNRPELTREAQQSWDVLLQPSLKGQLVLPSSPRVCIELMGADLDRLRRLRNNALANDEANGHNLLLRGKASVAVLPLQRLIPLLRQDPRLQVVLPTSGAPLTWQLLLRPKHAHAEPPLDWLREVLRQPLLARLLASGWVPPLERTKLQAAVIGLPQSLTQLLLPPTDVLDRCWNQPPLSASRRLAWQTLWDAATP